MKQESVSGYIANNTVQDEETFKIELPQEEVWFEKSCQVNSQLQEDEEQWKVIATGNYRDSENSVSFINNLLRLYSNEIVSKSEFEDNLATVFQHFPIITPRMVEIYPSMFINSANEHTITDNYWYYEYLLLDYEICDSTGRHLGSNELSFNCKIAEHKDTQNMEDLLTHSISVKCNRYDWTMCRIFYLEVHRRRW